ncbi:LOW QUALITY PROTEIN: transmembrane protein 202 [Dugong dugon]
MERREDLILTFYNTEVPKMKGNQNYQRPTLPTNKHPSTSMSPRQQQHVDQTHNYIRMFCGSLCGFSLLILIFMSPMNWVQFLVIKNGFELYAGLWTSCNHELCWSHTPQPPYYLQYSRAFFLISVFTILIGLRWLFRACLPRRGSMTTNLDLKVSMLIFTSDACLLLCLILFLAQVHWHSRDVVESNLLRTYHLNWWGDFLYMFVEKSRLGVGLVTTAKDEGSGPEVESQNKEERPNAGL